MPHLLEARPPQAARGGGSAGPTLGIDAHRLLGARSGVARYLGCLLAEWAKADLPFARVSLYSPAPLPEDALPAGHPFDVRVVRGRILLPALWEDWGLRRAARDDTVLFCPSNVAPLRFPGQVVLTMHDAMPAVLKSSFPWHSRYRNVLYRRAARGATRVLAPTQSAARDIESAYGVRREQLRRIALGVDPERMSATREDEIRVRQRHDLGDGPLVLFVGKFSQRRNLPALVRAFAEVRRAGAADHTLVLVGRNHLRLPLEELARELGLGRAVRLLGEVPDEDLWGLYRAAQVFAYPSDYEGFGLPILEALAAGTPVLTLDNEPLREVAGDAALLLPSGDADVLAEGLTRLIADEGLRRDYAARGRERARGYSWRETADRTMAVLAEVARAG